MSFMVISEKSADIAVPERLPFLESISAPQSPDPAPSLRCREAEPAVILEGMDLLRQDFESLKA